MALEFDGVDQYVKCGDANLPTGASNRTVSFWVRRPVAAVFGNNPFPYYYGNQGAVAQAFGCYGAIGTTNIIFYGRGRDFDTGIDLDNTNLHNIVFTYDGTNVRVYEDNVEASGSPSAQALNTVLTADDLVIGSHFPAIGEYFAGTIFDLRIYTRVLSAAERAALYYAQGADNIINGLVGRWLMNEKPDGQTAVGANTVIDISGQGNHGTPTNSPVYRASSIKLVRSLVSGIGT